MLSRLPRVARALRFMHSDGRQIDRTGPSTSPSLHGHTPPSVNAVQPPIPVPEIVDPSSVIGSSRPSHTSKGRPIPRRPARTIGVARPSGYPEPPSYPPPQDYLDNLDANRKEKHPLWQFFHVPTPAKARPTEDSKPLDSFGSVEAMSHEGGNLHSGRSWTAAELRQKSFKDLHTLWYLLLRERNVLSTQKEERRRLNIGHRVDGELLTKRAFRCRKTMARIKYVLNERRLGLIAAAGPQMGIEPPHIPWSASPSTDPAGATEAIRGEAFVPLHILRSKPRAGQVASDESFVEEDQLNEEEVESRDEGFGGGKEAEEFVSDVQVREDGRVEKKE
ncbi:hypothetical protein IAU60_004710 [Kwoniella sp. DSM 27419]